MIQKYAQYLRARGFRLTPQRVAILTILEEAGGHLTALEIFQRARLSVPGITETTVYRTLGFLTEQGLAVAGHMGSGQLVYENALSEHHHLICRACTCSCEIEHALLHDLYQQFYAKTGFTIDATHVTFFGLCPACQG